MDHDTDRIDDAVLALLYLTSFEEHGSRARRIRSRLFSMALPDESG